MTLLHHLLCVGCVAATLAPHSRAQTLSQSGVLPSENAMESWLRSGDPRLVAWGAHDALVTRNRDLIDELLALANRWQPLSQQTSGTSPHSELSPEQKDERDAMAAVLDTLIQMNVPVSEDTLRNLAPDFGNDVAIFLARMPDEEASALSFDLYRSPPEHGYALQYVSAALLALHPQPGFAADVLANIRVTATVFVVLPGSDGFGRGGGSGTCASSSGAPRGDWPATGQYALSNQRSDGASLLVAGTDPVYVTRKESTRYLGDDCSMSIGVYLGPNQRVRLIAQMLGVPPEVIPWQTTPVTNIEFQSLPQFHSALLAFIEEQQVKYRATADALAAQNLVTPAEAQQSLPELELKLVDMRGQGADPIPKPSNLPSRVEWSQEW